jgi:hypothetical protein
LLLTLYYGLAAPRPHLLVGFRAVAASLPAWGKRQPLLPASTATTMKLTLPLRLPLVRAAGRALRVALKLYTQQ